MCIRDRIRQLQPERHADERDLHANSFGDLERLGDIDADDPVSYTHLRAHETVLDLVCRLLLEKKKIKFSKDTLQHTQIISCITTVAQHTHEHVVNIFLCSTT